MLKAVLLDLDGTIYRGNELIAGAKGFVEKIETQGLRYLFITNNSTRTPVEVARHLQKMGVACEPGHVLTSSQAAAASIAAGRVYCIGENGLRLALHELGIEMADNDVSHVVVGMDRQINYQKIEKAARLIRAGAKFIATNPDRFFPTESGISPGNGAIVAAIAAAADRQPTVIGKPERTIIDIALKRVIVTADEAILIGDNLETDIPAGINAGVRTVFLLTGVSTRDDLAKSNLQPTWIAEDYTVLNDIFEDILYLSVKGKNAVFS